MSLNERAQFTPRAFQVARNAGFVFANLAADFRQRFLPRVVQLQTLAITAIERSKGGLQSGNESLEVAFTMRVKRRRGHMEFRKRLGLLAVGLIERFPAAAFAKAIDMALRQNGTQPRFQCTPAMKIAEQRTFAPLAIHQTVKFREERIGEFLGIGARTAASRYCAGGGPQSGAVLTHKIFPSRFRAFQAGGSEGQVLKVECLQILDTAIIGQSHIGEAL